MILTSAILIALTNQQRIASEFLFENQPSYTTGTRIDDL